MQDLRIGGRSSNALYQYTLQGSDLKDLNLWAPRLLQKMRGMPILTDVNSDQQNSGLQAALVVDRETASRLGLTQQVIDDTLYDAFGQRQVSTMYTPLNQYHVVMEAAPKYWQNPAALSQTRRALDQQRRSQTEYLYSLCAEHDGSLGKPPGAVSRRHALVQP